MIDLSLPRAATVGRFYTPIHTTIGDMAEGAVLPPTTAEFKAWLQRGLNDRPARGRALDAGCGVHTLNSGLLTKAGFDVIAVDVSDDAVGAAARAGMRTVRTSVAALSFEEASFSFVVCTGVAHHTPDPLAVFREIHRVLEPGGSAYVSVYAFEGSPFAWAVRALRLAGRVLPFSIAHRVGRVSPAVNNFVLDHMYVPVLWLFRAAELERAFTDIGFTIRENFVSAMDPFHARVGRAFSGDGLLRVFALGKQPAR